MRLIALIFCLLWGPLSQAKTTEEVLVIKATPAQVIQSLKGILEPEWSFDTTTLVAKAGDREWLFQINPVKKPNDDYSVVTIQRRERQWPSGDWVITFGEPELSLYKELLSALGVPKHHLEPTQEEKKLSTHQAKQIAFRLENGRNVYNPLGLVPLALAGTEGSFTGYFDIHIADRVQSLIESSEKRGIPLIFTSAFRPAPKQWRLFKNADTNPFPVATPGHSLHEAGFAFDIQINHWNSGQYKTFKTLADAYGFTSIGGDPIHFEADPTQFGYPNRESAIQKNQLDYYQNHSSM